MYVLHEDKIRNVRKVLGKRRTKGKPSTMVKRLAQEIALQRAAQQRRVPRAGVFNPPRGFHPSDVSRQSWIERERKLRSRNRYPKL